MLSPDIGIPVSTSIAQSPSLSETSLGSTIGAAREDSRLNVASEASLREQLKQLKLHERYGLLAAFVTIIVMVIGIGVPVFLHFLEVQEKARQHEQERIELEADTKKQRAFVAEDSAPELFLRDIRADGGSGEYTRFNYFFGNNGKTTATAIIMGAQTLALPRPFGASNDEYDAYAKKQLESMTLVTWPYPELLADHGHTGYLDDDRRLTRKDYQSMLHDNLRVYAFGNLRYPAAGQEERLFRFCVYAYADTHPHRVGRMAIGNCPFEIQPRAATQNTPPAFKRSER